VIFVLHERRSQSRSLCFRDEWSDVTGEWVVDDPLTDALIFLAIGLT